MDEKKLNEENKLIAFFRSEYFVLITFVTIITPLMMHTATLLLKVSSIQNDYYAYFFAGGFDLAIFAFAMNGRANEAAGLAFIVFALNVCFFNLEAMYKIFGAEEVSTQLIVTFVVTVIISAAGSWITHSYVVFFNEKIEERQNQNALYGKLDEGNREIATLKFELDASKKREEKKDESIRSMLQEIENLRQRASVISQSIEDKIVLKVEPGEIKFPYECSGCQQKIASARSLEMVGKFCKKETCALKQIQSIGAKEINIGQQLQTANL